MKAQDLWAKIRSAGKGSSCWAAAKGARGRRDYLDGNHFTAEEREEWKALNAETWSDDQLGLLVAALTEQVDVSSSIPMITARKTDDAGRKILAETRNNLYAWARELGRFDIWEAEAIETLVLDGICWVQTYMSVIDGKTIWKQEVVPLEQMKWDPAADSADLEDRSWHARGCFLTEADLYERFPAHAKAIMREAKAAAADQKSSTNNFWEDTETSLLEWSPAASYVAGKGYFVINMETRSFVSGVRIPQPTPEENYVAAALGFRNEADGSLLLTGRMSADFVEYYEENNGEADQSSWRFGERVSSFTSTLVAGNKIIFSAPLHERCFSIVACCKRLVRGANLKVDSLWPQMVTYQRQIDQLALGAYLALQRSGKGYWVVDPGAGLTTEQFEDRVAIPGAVIYAKPEAIRHEAWDIDGVDKLTELSDLVGQKLQARIGISKYATGGVDDLRRVSASVVSLVTQNAAAPLKPFIRAWLRLRERAAAVVVRQAEVYLDNEAWASVVGEELANVPRRADIGVFVAVGDTPAVQGQKRTEVLLGQGLLQQLEGLRNGLFAMPANLLVKTLGEALSLSPTDIFNWERNVERLEQQALQAQQQQALQAQQQPAEAPQAEGQ